MAFLDVSTNYTKSIMDTTTGRSLVFTPKTTDVDVITHLCTAFNNYMLFLFLTTLIVMLLKLAVIMMANRRPNNEFIQKTRILFENISDMLVIMLITINLLLFLASVGWF